MIAAGLKREAGLHLSPGTRNDARVAIALYCSVRWPARAPWPIALTQPFPQRGDGVVGAGLPQLLGGEVVAAHHPAGGHPSGVCRGAPIQVALPHGPRFHGRTAVTAARVIALAHAGGGISLPGPESDGAQLALARTTAASGSATRKLKLSSK